ncbi:DUF1559 domain-containing protein [Alienimonas sp. DA493]|uniref:DUF1559 family PulG-like putative transporter n=1 Tax=Alienimonas sp. DA493 TaxID=3373605 RepID=UPI0037541AFE
MGCAVATLALAAVVVSLFHPRIRGARMAAWRSATHRSLYQVGGGVRAFHEDRGALPPWAEGGEATVAGPGNPAPAWLTACLPHLGRGEVYEAYDLTVPFDAPGNAGVAGRVVDEFLCPDADYRDRTREGGFGLAHIAGNVRLLGEEGPRTFDGVTDGASHTLLAGQVGGFPRPWADPTNLRDTADGIGGSPHQFGGSFNGGTAVMCDGSVHFLSEAIDPAVLAALGTPDGGEDVGAF